MIVVGNQLFDNSALFFLIKCKIFSFFSFEFLDKFDAIPRTSKHMTKELVNTQALIIKYHKICFFLKFQKSPDEKTMNTNVLARHYKTMVCSPIITKCFISTEIWENVD